MAEMAENLLVTVNGGVCTITINRPGVRNALDVDTAKALRAALDAAQRRDETRVVVLTGAGGAFGSGADIKAAMSAAPTPAQAHQALTDAYAPAIQAVYSFPWPVIAAVDGPAAGISCDLALACDVRLVSARAVFMELFIRMGLIPDGGGTYLLPRLVGLGRALELMLTGARVEADEALRIGLANRSFPVETFAQDVAAFAAEMAGQSPLALLRGKQAMKAALEDRSLADAMAREAAFQREILEGPDGFEGFLAFVQKRPPQWSWTPKRG
ncbi:MAG: enoyl-CoA hydratase/isomerase family protein [Anaerolineae bacterium]|nr:enoyl-CoA hydratase/isomerase family protein [Anaerolineae bacterium]